MRLASKSAEPSDRARASSSFNRLSYASGSRAIQQHGERRTRTADTSIFSRVLYQLSYLAAAHDPSVSTIPADERDDPLGAAASLTSTGFVQLVGVAAIDGQVDATMLA
jgi:hypothetical protein